MAHDDPQALRDKIKQMVPEYECPELQRPAESGRGRVAANRIRGRPATRKIAANESARTGR